MIDLKPILTLRGDRFSPGDAERATGLVFTRKAEVGDAGGHARPDGRRSPCGSAGLRAPAAVSSEDRVDWLLDIAERHLPTLLALGVTTCKFHVDVLYWDQCNLWFPPRQIARLSTLSLPLSITCYDRTSREIQGDPGHPVHDEGSP